MVTTARSQALDTVVEIASRAGVPISHVWAWFSFDARFESIEEQERIGDVVAAMGLVFHPRMRRARRVLDRLRRIRRMAEFEMSQSTGQMPDARVA